VTYSNNLEKIETIRDEGTRRTEPGSLFEVTRRKPPHALHPDCPWCHGTGRFTGRASTREVDCLCRFARLSTLGAELDNALRRRVAEYRGPAIYCSPDCAISDA
jgi:hypothetical protein